MGNVVGKSRKEYNNMRGKPREDGTNHSGFQAGTIAAGKGLGGVGMALTKTAIDLPHAFTEGFHNIPTLYGDKVRDHGPVTDWKSGGIVGLKVRTALKYSDRGRY
jgi:sterol 3beta-glucosyltransferase